MFESSHASPETFQLEKKNLADKAVTYDVTDKNL